MTILEGRLCNFRENRSRDRIAASPPPLLFLQPTLSPTTIMLGVAATALTLLTAASGVEAGVHRFVHLLASSDLVPPPSTSHAS